MKDDSSLIERYALSSSFSQPVESFLSWSLALSCLVVSGYYYVVQKLTLKKQDPFALVPLVTYTKEELFRCTQRERFNQLQLMLERLVSNRDGEFKPLDDVNDQELVDLFRENHILRRLATLAMATGNSSDIKRIHHSFSTRLVRLWPEILVHPRPKFGLNGSCKFRLSLIIPIYNESMEEVYSRLELSLSTCRDPSTIQVVLVLASPEPEDNKRHQPRCGEVKTVLFKRGTGRGPCLNFGAQHASGAMLSFCHSDTRLPWHWDEGIMREFPNACAFSFGIDTPSRHVPGLRAVEVTANLRCKLWALPYGDQCISLPADLFWHIGGYPHQCIMEDYELVTLLRAQNHIVRMIPGYPALCSPRRWVSHGVLYVTFTNSRLVRAYKTGNTAAHEIYRQYYGRTMHVDDMSPWESELSSLLRSNQD